MAKKKSTLSAKHLSDVADGSTSWEQWVKTRIQDHEKNKKSSAVEQPELPEKTEVVQGMAESPGQRKRKRKEHGKSKESPKKPKKSDLVEPETRSGDNSENLTSASTTEHMKQGAGNKQQKKKRKALNKSKESARGDFSGSGTVEPEANSGAISENLISASATEHPEQVVPRKRRKPRTRRRKKKHEEVNQELNEVQNSTGCEQSKGENVEQEKHLQNQSSSSNKEKNDSPPKMPGSVLSFLATKGMSRKELKQKMNEECKRMWKEKKEVKKLKKLEESMTAKIQEEKKEAVGKGRNYTVSIALPGSILDNAQSPELKTYLAGQIARAAAVFNVNEIVIFEETANSSALTVDEDAPIKLRQKHGSTQLMKILHFLECPQYLRRYFFPLQSDLKLTGVLNPLDMPHHLRVNDVSPYREGVTLDKPVKDGKGSYVYIGFQKSAVIDKPIESNIRVTVKLDETSRSKKHYTGVAVSPTTPYKQDGIYWGYTVRLAESLGAVFSKCPFKEGYDLTIGTSDKGTDVDHCVLPSFKHLLIVFGGLKGLEASLEADEKLTIGDPRFLFNHYLNTCPSQGARTIRTEEAILITLSVLRPKILQCQTST